MFIIFSSTHDIMTLDANRYSPLSSGKDVEAGRATAGGANLEGLRGGSEESKGGNSDLHGG